MAENWKMLLRQARQLRSQGVGLVYDRVVLLAPLAKDPEFEAWCHENNENYLDNLDSEFDDVGYDFSTLQACLKEFPDRNKWLQRGVRGIVEDAIASAKRQREARGGATPTKTWKERALLAEKELADLQKEVNTLRHRVWELERLLAVSWS